MKKVKLKQVLKNYKNKHLIQNDKSYRQVTISQTGEVSFRGEKHGINIGRKRQFLIDLKNHPNTLIFIRQGVMKGGIGICPPDVDGCVVTENMPMFEIVNINPNYLLNFIKSPMFKEDVSKLVPIGTAQKALHENKLLEIEIPYPSEKEQEKIVRKINSMENEIKQLEKNVFHDKTLLTKLKQTILTEAVQGKLVPQNLSDESAIELLKKIKKEKEKLIKEGKIKSGKELPVIEDGEIPYELPRGWIWTRLGDVFDVRDGTHDTPKYVKEGIPLVTSRCFENGRINFELAKKISLDDHKKIIQRSLVEKEDILFSMIGGNLGNMVFVNTSKEFSIKNVALFKYYDKEITKPRFLEIFLKYLSYNIQNKSGGGAQPFIPLKFFRNYIIGLPPLAEQRRIVKKVDALMRFCDELELRIKENKESSERLMGAVLRESFVK